MSWYPCLGSMFGALLGVAVLFVLNWLFYLKD